MNTISYRRWLPLTLGTVGVVLIVLSVIFFSHKVLEAKPGNSDDPFQLFQRISEPRMVIDATFGGVALTENGLLYSTYDRTAALGGHQPCPT